MNPLISVLMPVRRPDQDLPDQYLDEAINSVLGQSLDNFELLLVGYPDSGDWSCRIPEDSRIKILHRREPGIVAGLNTGLAFATGQYIARMDADDIALPDRFEQQLHYLNTNPSVNIAGARVEIFNSGSSLQAGNKAYQDWLNSVCTPTEVAHNLFVESPLPHPTLFAARSVFDKLQGYSACQWAEDYDLLLRACLAGFRMGKPEPVLLRWRDHGQRLTRNDERYSRLNFIRAKAWALSRSLAHNRPVIICGIGRNALRLCDTLHEYGVEVRCFVEQDEAPKKHSRRHLPVITYSELPGQKKDALLVTAVTAYGARDKLRDWFVSVGWTEMSDFVIAG